MLRLRRQLGRLRDEKASNLKASSSLDPRIIQLRRQIGSLLADKSHPRPKDRPSTETVKVEDMMPKNKVVRVLSRSLGLDHHHGEVSIADGLTPDPEVLSRLCFDESLKNVDPLRLLYLDTETTGLHGGAGTLAFLIGLAWYEDGCLRVEQLMMENPSSEYEQLELLKERVERASGLVTYNGRRFDWPLLANRFVLNRMTPPSLEYHIDLLFPARRLYKKRLESARLVKIESEVLGFERVDDIDGSEIPSRYWEYVRTNDALLIDPILEHNLNDLVAMAAMLGRFTQQYCGLGTNHAVDRLSAAKLAIAVGDVDHGLRLAHGLVSLEQSDVRCQAALLIAKTFQHQAAYPEAVSVLESALRKNEEQAEIHLALAKLYEHKIRNLKTALSHAKFTEDIEGREGQRKRLCRLRRRLARVRKQ